MFALKKAEVWRTELAKLCTSRYWTWIFDIRLQIPVTNYEDMPWTTDMLTSFLPSRKQMSLVDTNDVGCTHRAHHSANRSFLGVNKSGFDTSR